MNLEKEKARTLSSADVYAVIDFALQTAEDSGFINSYLFEKMLYCYAAITLYQDRKEEIAAQLTSDPLGTFDALLDDGTIDKMLKEYAADLEYIAENGQIWFNEFTHYSCSARGLFGVIQEFSNDIVAQATQQLKAATSNPELQQVTDIAEKWGMNNSLFSPKA
jgi:hypothetical protein